MSTSDPNVKPKRRRGLKVLALLALVFAGLLAAAPMLLSPFVRDRVASELSTRTGGTASFETLELGWTGTHAAGLKLADDEGRPVLDVREVDAAYSVLALLSGGVEANVAASGVDVHLRKDGDAWNLQKIAEKLGGESTSSDDDKDEDGSSGSKDLPSVVADVRVDKTNVIVHSPTSNETTEIRDVAFTLDVDGLDQSSPFDMSLLLTGPGQEKGARLSANGHVTARATNGDPAAHVTFDLEPLSLTAFAPVLDALGLSAAAPEGLLTGDGTWDWKGGAALDGRSALTMRDARMVLDGNVLELPLASLTASAELDDTGSGSQTLRVEAGELLDVDLDGTYASEGGELVGKAQARGALAEAFKTLAPWVTLKDGVSVGGQWAVTGDWNVQGVVPGAKPDGLTANIVADLSDLAARSAEGTPIDLGELTAVHLDVAATARTALSELDVSKLVVKAGPLDVNGTLSVAGLDGATPTLRDSNITYNADLGRLMDLAGSVVDFGALSLRGVVDGSLVAKGGAEKVDVDARTTVAGFAASGLGDPSALRDIGPFDISTSQVATIDPGGLIDIASFSLDTPFAAVAGRGTVTPPQDEGVLPVAKINATYSLVPAQLQTHLVSLLPVGFDAAANAPLTGDVDITTTATTVKATGELARDGLLAITLPPSDDGLTPARTVRTSDITGRYDVTADMSGDAPRVTLTKLDLGSSTGALGVKGTVALAGPDAANPVQNADIDVELSTSLVNMFSDLADFVSASGVAATGAGAWTVNASTNGGATWNVKGNGGIDALTLALPVNANDLSKPQQLSFAPGRTDTSWDVAVTPATLDVDLKDLSGGWNGLRFNARGALRELGALSDPLAPAPTKVESLSAELRYVPDRLQEWFGSLLPVTLSGADEQTATVDLSGPLRLVEGDPLATLADLRVDADVGLGRASLPFVDVGGAFTADVMNGALALGSDVDVNGGKASFTMNGPLRDVVSSVVGGSPDGAQGAATTIALNWNGVGADAKLGGALENVHPLLASLDPNAGASGFASQLGGLIDLSYAGALLPDALSGAIDLSAFSGNGRLAFGEMALAASPLLGDMLTNLGGTGERKFEVAPLEFSVDRGTFKYDKPWAWNMGGVATSFSGSVGFDQGIDLKWALPITDALVAKHSFLERLEGEAIEIPLVGTLTDPRLALDGVLSDLASRAAKREFEGRIDDALPGLDIEIPGLEGLTGNADKKDREDPKALLAEADRLWAAGDADAARPIYKRLEDDFKFSLVVLANKGRIEDRAEKPKPKKLKTVVEEEDEDGGKKGDKKKSKKKKDKKKGKKKKKDNDG